MLAICGSLRIAFSEADFEIPLSVLDETLYLVEIVSRELGDLVIGLALQEKLNNSVPPVSSACVFKNTLCPPRPLRE